MTEKKPSARASKAERIMNLVSFLLRQDEPVPISSIIGAVAGYDDGATRDSLLRRFERDKQVLRDIGVPIEYEAPSSWGTEGYRIAKDAYYLGEVKLSRNAARLLPAIFETAGRGPSGELSNDLRSAALKLGFVAGEDTAETMLSPGGDGAFGHHLDLKLGSSPQVGKNLETLIEAVLRQKRVSMKYYTIHRDELTSREVDPYGLGYAGQAWNRGAWYLVGHCHLRDAPRVFKVDRIRGGVKIVKDSSSREDFERPSGFKVRDHLNKARWEMRELAAALGGGPAKAEEVVVRFPTGIASAVRELVPSCDVVSENAETATLRFRVQARRAFCRFLLPYAGQLEVVSPRDLDASLEELAREVLAKYGKPA